MICRAASIPFALAPHIHLGGASADTRNVLAFGAAQRHISAAFVVGVENFSDPDVVVRLIVVVQFSDSAYKSQLQLCSDGVLSLPSEIIFEINRLVRSEGTNPL
jgi:hypothetical protein